MTLEKPAAMRLTAITYAAEQVHLYELRPVSGTSVPPFTAGAHVDLHLPNGLVRQYSIANAQDERHRYVLGVKRDAAGRGGSRFLHDELRVGAVVEVGGPRNNFPLVEAAAHSVLIAGGIGVTPIVSMVARLRSLARPWELHYAVRRRREAAFLDELLAGDGHVRLHVDEEQGGLIDVAAHRSRRAARRRISIVAARRPCSRRSRPPLGRGLRERVHLEYFSSAVAPAVESGFVVELARSKLRVEIPPGQTILEALRARGLEVQSSCEQGICGSCETRVLAGEPDHRDMLLSDEEKATNQVMMICCSGSRSAVLVLDL